VAALAALTLCVLPACGGGDDDLPSSRVFQAPTWTGEEHLTYRLSQKGVPDAGTCELQTVPPAAGTATLTLKRLCGKDEFRDDSTALVDATTLEPQQATRTRTDSVKNKRAEYTNTYSEDTVQFQADIDGKQSKTTRDLPKPTKDAPEPGWYDDDAILWLVRGIPLRSGYTAAFTYVINGGQPRLLTTTVKVDGTEDVTTPAGQFSTWRVRLTRETVSWVVNVDQASPNRIVQARIEDVTYTLTDVK